MIQPSSAAVIGGGIGGLAAAIALLQAGWDVRVYEQAGPRSEVGAGIQLAPNCTRILRRLGVLSEVGHAAVRPTMLVTSRNGSPFNVKVPSG